MAIRSGMELIVDEVILNLGNTDLITEEQIQSILDKHKKYLKSHLLKSNPTFQLGEYKYYLYKSDFPYLESGSGVFRLFDSTGANITTDFTVDYLLGQVVFDNDQTGAIRYIDGITYDFNAAVGDCWRLLQAQTAHMYDFSLEDRKFTRSQWFDHCKAMAEYYSNLASFSSNKTKSIPIIRGDYANANRNR